MSELSVRPAASDEYGKLAALEMRVQPAPWSESAFAQEALKPYAHVWVLTDDETDERLVGYLVFWILDAEMHILNLGVEPESRRQGHARTLLSAAISKALREGVKRTTLEVRKSNAGAVHFYHALGYTIEHVRKRFYSDGEDAYVMALYLEGDPYAGF